MSSAIAGRLELTSYSDHVRLGYNCQKCQGGHAVGLNLGQPVFPLSSRAPCEQCLCAFDGPIGGVGGEWFLLNLYFLCVFINVGGLGIVCVTFHGEKV